MILAYLQHVAAHVAPGLVQAHRRLVAIRRGLPLPVTADEFWLHGPKLHEAWPTMLWGVTAGLKVPCADGTVQRLYPPGKRVPSRCNGRWWWVRPGWESKMDGGWEVFTEDRCSELDAGRGWKDGESADPEEGDYHWRVTHIIGFDGEPMDRGYPAEVFVPARLGLEVVRCPRCEARLTLPTDYHALTHAEKRESRELREREAGKPPMDRHCLRFHRLCRYCRHPYEFPHNPHPPQPIVPFEDLTP